MPEKRVSYLPLIFVILTIVVGVVLRSFIMEYVIHPVANLLWFGWQKISTVDQVYYWIGLIILCTFIGLLIFVPRKKQKLRSAYDFEYLPPGRFAYWQGLFEEGEQGDAGRDNLRQALLQLLTKVKDRDSLSDDKNFYRSASDFEHFSDTTQNFLFPPSGGAKSYAGFRAKIERLLKKSKQEEKLAIEEILSWIENELEINYGTN